VGENVGPVNKILTTNHPYRRHHGGLDIGKRVEIASSDFGRKWA